MRVPLTNLATDAHQLVVKGLVKITGQVLQKTYGVNLINGSTTAAYDYVFLTGVASYRARGRVLQPKTGRIYQCNPYPNSGYCMQWSPNPPQFEPGVGAYWTNAWNLQ